MHCLSKEKWRKEKKKQDRGEGEEEEEGEGKIYAPPFSHKKNGGKASEKDSFS